MHLRHTLLNSLLGVGVGGILLGAAVKGWVLSAPVKPLSVYGQVPTFSLVDQHRRPVTPESLAGSVWVADFIFTRCAGQCPMMSHEMAGLQESLRDLPQVQLVSFSVDPAYDTPERLAAYATRYGADERWRFATGSVEAVRRVAQDGFRLGISEDGTDAEPITHSVRLVLVDQQGEIRGYYDATEPSAMRQLRHDIRRLLKAHT